MRRKNNCRHFKEESRLGIILAAFFFIAVSYFCFIAFAEMLLLFPGE
jgi:hypothetical protein